jgi:hypothetical protein
MRKVRIPNSTTTEKTHCLPVYLLVFFALATCSVYCAQRELELEHYPQGVPISIDANPCGKINVAENVQLLEKHIIAYYFFSKEQISSIKVRLTCEYKEKNMPPNDQPSLSRKKFQKILRELDKRKKFGKKLRDDATSISGHVYTYTQTNEHARISWSEYECQEDNVFGCGIKRIDVTYIK